MRTGCASGRGGLDNAGADRHARARSRFPDAHTLAETILRGAVTSVRVLGGDARALAEAGVDNIKRYGDLTALPARPWKAQDKARRLLRHHPCPIRPDFIADS